MPHEVPGKDVASNAHATQPVANQVKEVIAAQLATLFALVKLTEARDSDTGRHIERVQTFARALAEQMRKLGLHLTDMNDAFVDNVYQTASLHDVGKVAIPDAILLKPGKLTTEEFDVMKKHSAYGADTLAAVLRRYPDNQFLRMGVDVARSHHERWDGSAYPDGLSGTGTPLSP